MRALLAALLALGLAGCGANSTPDLVGEAQAQPVQDRPPEIALGFHIDQTPLVISGITVYDGDTFDAGRERFRPQGIDTPEMGHRAHCELEQARAVEAKAAAEQIFANARVVTVTPTDNRRDRYSRVLVNVDVDGRDYGEMLIERGLAMPYRRRPGWNWCATPVAPCTENSDACGRG